LPVCRNGKALVIPTLTLVRWSILEADWRDRAGVTDPIDAIAELFEREGTPEYLGEAVSLSVHMLQAGILAELAGAPDHLVAAALLHDVGHLHAVASAGPAPHEDSGARWLAVWLPVDVTEPIRLHVAAKRYLCATQPDYLASLSQASVESLAVQGGVMNTSEARLFELLPYAHDAIALRRWDEAAKDPSAPTLPFDHFRPRLARLRERTRSASQPLTVEADSPAT
jgi:gamma-butyrobetaine dioxygenase